MADSPRSSTPMTASQLRQWLREWVAGVTEVPVEEVTDDRPLENLGLSSRDAVLLSGELENLLGRKLDATVVYEHPTIGALATHLLSGGAGSGKFGVVGTAPIAQTSAAPEDHDIAVVGMATRFPGAEGLEQMWSLLVEGRDGTTANPPEGRWSEYEGDPVARAKMAEQNLAGGYLEDISSFDAEFFGLSPLEATNMDPQQRIMLELSWEALEHAHLPANELRGTPVGVFYGSSNNDYGMLIASDPQAAHPYALTGTSSAVIPNRVSYAFDFRGPSVAVDTACSSSLVAVHQAIRALRAGDATVALAGGVNIMASPFISTSFGELGVISPSGHIHAFSDDADGFVRSDGAGVFVLKRVSDAVAHGDTILAVLRGSAINSDGHSNGLTAPNPEAQVDVLRRAYADAGVDPAQVDYVEAHGTGTVLGDPIEATALGEVLGAGREASNPTLLGSAKSNFGHSESAAGSAGLAKVILSMKNEVLPPSIHFVGPNRYIDFDAERLEVVEDPREWPQYSGRKIAGVSGFGFGGTNAHVVVSDFEPADYPGLTPQVEGHLNDPEDATALLPVSGHLPSRRKAQAAALAAYLEEHQDTSLLDLERTLAGRNHGRSRAVVQADSVEEAIKRLSRVAEGKKSLGITVADSPAATGPVFVYSGFGSQHRKMAKDLVALSAFFRDRLEELDSLVQYESGWSMMGLILDDEQTYNTETAQVTITAIQIALTDLLADLGVRPAGVMGMSMGEIAAAYASGGLTAREAMRIACHRSRLMGEGENSLAEDELGAMAVVELSTEALTALGEEEERFARIEPAVYTAPGMTTVGGPRPAVAALVERLEGEGKFARLLAVKGAGHTSSLDPILGELAAEIEGLNPRPLHTPLFSSVDRGRVYQPGETVHDVDYFLRCTRHSVWFQDSTEAAFAAGHTTLVEIAPNPVAMMGMMSTAFAAGKPEAQLLFALKRKVPAATSLRDLLSTLYVNGAPVDFRKVRGLGATLSDAPGIQWKKQPYWTAARPSSGNSALPGTKVTLPDARLAFGTEATQVPSALALMEAAVAAVDPKAKLVANQEHAPLPATGEVTTIVSRHLGGLSLAVYAGSGTALAEGFAASAGLPGIEETPAAPAPAAPRTGIPDARGEIEVETRHWDPNSGETVEQRLRSIVSESMGYEAEDLPLELPLIDLGLDSLMGMRIKNRIENDFQIPPLQVQALRDGSVADVITLVEQAVAGKAEAAAEPQAAEQQESAEDTTGASPSENKAQGVGVAPRDASERLVFATWAGLAGAAAAGVNSELPEVSAEVAEAIAARLSERSGVEITAEQVAQAQTLEPLADLVREGLETEVEGNIRVLRERPEGSQAPAVFMFHPAGGSSVVYQPLMRRLPEEVPVYGVERREGALEERAAAYLDEIREYAKGHPVILGGWSFGGALAYEVAHQLRDSEVEVRTIALLDTVQPAEAIPDTLEETKARWERYSAFAKKTYGLDFPVPYELLETAGEEAMLGMLTEFLSTTDVSEHGLAAGVLEHQRASFVDNRILDSLDMQRWADVNVPVLLFRAERMHEGAIELEPAYANITPDGGWAAIVEDLEIVQLHGDHLAVVDEPEIATVGAHLTRRIENLERGSK
ncbi:polyketide synthase Pks13 [Corynebacterium lowii]|uniref:Phthiocerol/phenolphthiocerol synthesis polyketide synthase type I PpsA n=1 Tax=Corynebacterium lowii TaxID=1544413 RepID=A0A0Q0UB82_9CORY|nr:polyketide synthase Pks13 [Corynebacterium lowii]KQB83469.1 Phthiocerol/phenolphthiocerol synthesis polyketide synthase type I PpsA [Corynebacterium lowii]MDP9852515.1 polyketide synthase 13 [Corynebacterium lowii]